MPHSAYALEPQSCFGPSLVYRGLKAIWRKVHHRGKPRVLPTFLINVASGDSLHLRCDVPSAFSRTPTLTDAETRYPLPLDVWGEVAKFVPSDVLSRVCRTLRQFLPRRHLVLHVTPANVQSIAERYESDPNVRRLVVSCRAIGDEEGRHLKFLGCLPALKSLTVQLWVHQFGNSLTDPTVAAVAEVAQCSQLQSLQLDLQCAVGGLGNGQLTDAALGALARLGGCRSLQSLALNLSGNPVHGSGLAVLVGALQGLPALKALELNLTSTGIGQEGVTVLGALRAFPVLETLQLHLTSSGATDEGLLALCRVLEGRALRHLGLDLGCTKVGDTGLQAFVEACCQASHLRTLALDVSCTTATAEGLCGLANLARMPRLQQLTLLIGRLATDEVVGALCALKAAPRLCSLSLGLASSPVGDAGAAALVALGSSPTLRSLVLDLSRSAVGDEGARALTALALAPALSSLTLVLAEARLGIGGRAALRRLRAKRVWRDLRVFCYSHLDQAPPQKVYEASRSPI